MWRSQQGCSGRSALTAGLGPWSLRRPGLQWNLVTNLLSSPHVCMHAAHTHRHTQAPTHSFHCHSILCIEWQYRVYWSATIIILPAADNSRHVITARAAVLLSICYAVVIFVSLLLSWSSCGCFCLSYCCAVPLPLFYLPRSRSGYSCCRAPEAFVTFAASKRHLS